MTVYIAPSKIERASSKVVAPPRLSTTADDLAKVLFGSAEELGKFAAWDGRRSA